MKGIMNSVLLERKFQIRNRLEKVAHDYLVNLDMLKLINFHLYIIPRCTGIPVCDKTKQISHNFPIIIFSLTT